MRALVQGGLGEAAGLRGERSRRLQCTRKMGGWWGLLRKVGSLLSLEGQGGLGQWREVLAVLTTST